MGNYYLDIETTGLDEVVDKIITIQYVELERGTGKQIGELKIFKEWENGEEEMLRQFIIDSPIVNSYDFDFVPVGYNLGFEHKFLLEKTGKYKKLFPISVLSRPVIDLHSIGILMNNGEFRGSGLDKLTGKPHGGSPIPTWYKLGEYEKIEQYIKKETEEFKKLFHKNYYLYSQKVNEIYHQIIESDKDLELAPKKEALPDTQNLRITDMPLLLELTKLQSTSEKEYDDLKEEFSKLTDHYYK